MIICICHNISDNETDQEVIKLRGTQCGICLKYDKEEIKEWPINTDTIEDIGNGPSG